MRTTISARKPVARTRSPLAAHAAAPAASVPPSVDVEELKAQVVAEEAKYVLQTYSRPEELVISHGEGSYVYDVSGKKYLDFAAGIAVNALGHSHPQWVAAVQEQVELAKKLVESSFADKVFFCNSGTEANEGAIKFARKFARVSSGADAQDASATVPTEIVTFTNSFHGRTMGALALTSKTQYRTPFGPVMPGAVQDEMEMESLRQETMQAEWCNTEAAAQCIQKGKTAAVFVEPVQGEGGVNAATGDFLASLRELCDEAGALLVFDEVQCGVGRTGKLWAHENYGITPDLMSVAKPLAGGLPIGAVLMTQRVADVMAPGDHGSTFAGNPLVCAAANTTFDIISEPSFLESVISKGERLRAGIRAACEDNPNVLEVRGSGLLVGVQLSKPAGGIVGAARNKGVLVITAGAGDVVRLVPPLTCSEEEIDECVAVLARCIADL